MLGLKNVTKRSWREWILQKTNGVFKESGYFLQLSGMLFRKPLYNYYRQTVICCKMSGSHLITSWVNLGSDDGDVVLLEDPWRKLDSFLFERNGPPPTCDLCHDHGNILGQTHKDHRTIGVQIIAEANLVAPMHLDGGDVNPQRRRVSGSAEGFCFGLC